MAASESAGHPGVIAARSVDDNAPNDVNVDPTSGALYNAQWVWNTSTLAWEKMIQPVGYTQGELDLYWKHKLLDFTSGNLDYFGRSTTHKAATDAGDLWWIWKYTWSGGNLTVIEGPLNDNWDDRASLAWDA